MKHVRLVCFSRPTNYPVATPKTRKGRQRPFLVSDSLIFKYTTRPQARSPLHPSLLFLQEMRIQMALDTDRHLLVDGGAVRLTMASPALRHRRMAAAVTEGTGKGLMLGGGLGHELADLLMTRYAEGAGGVDVRHDLQGMVGRMTGKTVGHDLALGMGLVTPGAIGNLAMLLMTEVTGLLGVLARILGKLLALLLMAGQTFLDPLTLKYDTQGVMGINMTAETIVQGKVGFIAGVMAH